MSDDSYLITKLIAIANRMNDEGNLSFEEKSSLEYINSVLSERSVDNHTDAINRDDVDIDIINKFCF